MVMKRMGRAALVAWVALAAACNDDDGIDGPAGRFGEVTSAVVIVNPVINQGSTTSVVPGSARASVRVQAADGPTQRTDASGLALLEDIPTGAVPLQLEQGSYTLQVVQERELYDVVLAVRDGAVEPVLPSVRYPLGGTVVRLEPGESIAQAAAADGTIVVLQPGTYPGNFELPAEGVLIFGAWDPVEGQLSTIEGDVTVRGGGIRMRGVNVTGRLTSAANNFSLAFSRVGSATITGNGVSLLRNTFVAGQATVPSSSAVLVDNVGIP
jgi:hypothetical protein